MDDMPSTQIDCPYCDAKAGTPCVPKTPPHTAPMNHAERHVAWREQEEARELAEAEAEAET